MLIGLMWVVRLNLLLFISILVNLIGGVERAIFNQKNTLNL